MLKDWFKQISTTTIELGYGSLMNQSSREMYNNINSPCLPLKVEGWKRQWLTRSIEEKQTYVGALKSQRCVINAQAVPTAIDESLLRREVDYRFVEVHPDSIQFSEKVCPGTRHKINECRFYICESLLVEAPTKAFPVYQTYLDTCLAGCIEAGGIKEAQSFMKSTYGWPSFGIINDRDMPKYPRVGSISKETYAIIDKVFPKND
jgi:hypothetical protein